MPRFSQDYRTLFWAFVLFPGVACVNYVAPTLVGWLLPLSLYLSYCSGIFAHNHNHCPTFKNRRANQFFSAWISVFYGYPVFAWIPTHNTNHHKFVNRRGDHTITWRHTNDHTPWIAFSYFFVSAFYQGEPIREYVRKARLKGGAIYAQILVQSVTVPMVHLVLLALAIRLHGVALGTLVYLVSFGIPAAFALWSLMFTNYIQHVHCDPWSKYNHSRNFVSPWVNWFVFEAGYHTVHHEHPGTHWSQYPDLHARRADRIAPELNEHSIGVFCLKNYVFGLFIPSLRTRQVGRAPTSSLRRTRETLTNPLMR